MSNNDEPAKLSPHEAKLLGGMLILVILFGVFCISVVLNHPKNGTTTATTIIEQASSTGPEQQIQQIQTVTTTQTDISSTTATSPTIIDPNIIQNQPEVYVAPTYQNCGYQYGVGFNPYLCNEGNPVNVIGWLSNDGSCISLHDPQIYDPNGIDDGQMFPHDIALYNVTQAQLTGLSGNIVVQGYVYPNWNSATQFPPFQPYSSNSMNCGGYIPMYAINAPQVYS